MKVLLLEDDLALSDILYDHLTHMKYDVTLVYDGESALEQLVTQKFDFALLDINTPKLSGIEVLKSVRNEYQNKTPIIILTAYQDIKHLKASFELGSDDYIKKPFDLEELNQRIIKLCRQYSLNNTEQIHLSENIIFEPSSCEIVIENKKIKIAQKEKDILKYFFTHKNRVVSTEELLQNIWEYDEMPSDATIRVYIKNLREIIGKDKITTIRSIGYKFEY